MTIHDRITHLLRGAFNLTADEIIHCIPAVTQDVLDAMAADGRLICNRGRYRNGAATISDPIDAAEQRVRDLTKQRDLIDQELRIAVAQRDALRAS